MRKAKSKPSHSRRARRQKPPHHVIIARGDKIRSFTLRPWLTAGIGLFAFAFLGIYLAATAYLFLRDDLVGSSLAKQDDIRSAYEARIAQLRAQLDRVTSRQVVDQEAIQARLEDLVGRQNALSQRQAMLIDLAAAARSAGIDLPGTTPTPLANPARADKSAANAAAAAPRTRVAAASAANLLSEIRRDPVDAADHTLSTVAETIDTIEQNQFAAIQVVAETVNGQADQLSSALRRLGHRPPAQTGVGGPFVPVADGDIEDFREGVEAVSDGIEQLASLRDYARQLPLARPVEGDDIRSGFGRRRDPFLGRLAMHTGVDFAEISGTPVHATGPGRVISAGRNAGYGLMVEVDHGGGLTSRYAHLSRILVKEGDIIEEGQVVGRVGTTGRSTGPHLHYEVRRFGRPVDPMPYLKAGAEIRALL